MVESCVLDRVLTLSALDRDALALLGASARVETFAGLIDRDPSARRWLEQGALLDREEIATAVDLASRAAMARGDLARVADLGDSDGLAVLIRSAQEQDWEAVIRHGEALTTEAAGLGEVLLLVGAARIYRLDGRRGEAMLQQAVARLRTEGDLRRPSFWAAADLLSGDPEMGARVTAAFAADLPGDPSVVIVAEPARPATSRLKPLLARVVARGRALLRRSSPRTPPAASDDKAAADTSRQAAETAFAQGQVQQGLAMQRRANAQSGRDEPDRVFSALIRSSEDLRQDATTVKLARLPDGAWVAELRHAEVWGGANPGVVLTGDGSVILDGLSLDAGLVVGQPGSVLRARSAAGEALVDLAGRPAPWRALEPTVLIGGSADDDAWLLDHLPKIEVWRRSGLGTGISARFLVHAGLTPRQAESLRRLGITADSLVRSNPYGTPRYDRLIVPSIASIGQAVETLRAGLLAGPSPEPRSLVYLSDLDGAAVGELTLIQMLKRIGVAVVRPADHGYPTLAKRLAAARAVVVAVGAPVAPLAFCARGVPVVQLGQGQDRAGAIADHLGLAYETFDGGADALLTRIIQLGGGRS